MTVGLAVAQDFEIVAEWPRFELLRGFGSAAAVGSDDTVYVSKGLGFLVLDVSDPTTPEPAQIVKLAGNVSAMLVDDGHLYVAVGRDIETYDVSDPRQAIRVSARASGAMSRGGLVKFGDFLFGVNYDQDVYSFDASNPASPAPLADLATGVVRPRDLAITGSILVVAGETLVFFYDVREPKSPELMSTMDIGAERVVARGDRVFLAGEDPMGGGKRLYAVDISDIQSPRLAESVSYKQNSREVNLLADDDRVYVPGYAGTVLGIVDANDLGRISRVERPGSAGFDGYPVKVVDQIVYLIESNRIRVIDVANPSSPQLLRILNADGNPSDLVAKGNEWVVAMGGNGVQAVRREAQSLVEFDIGLRPGHDVYWVSGKDQRIVLSSTDEMSVIERNADGEWTEVAGWAPLEGVRILKLEVLSDVLYVFGDGPGRERFRLLARFDMASNAAGGIEPIDLVEVGAMNVVDVDESSDITFFAAADDGVIVIRRNDSGSLSTIGAIATEWPTTSVAVGLDKLYVVSTEMLHFLRLRSRIEEYDVSDPSWPLFVSRLDLDTVVEEAALLEPYLLARYEKGVFAVDFSSFSQPAIIGSHGGPQYLSERLVLGEGELGFAHSAGIQVLSFASHNHLRLVGQVIGDLYLAPRRLSASETVAAISGFGGRRIAFVDLRDKSNPAIVFPETDREYMGVATVGHWVYALPRVGGLRIWDVQSIASPMLVAVAPHGREGAINRAVHVSDSIALVGGSNWIEALDVANPAEPKLIGNYRLRFSKNSHAVDLSRMESLVAYGSDQGAVELVSIENPASPEHLSLILGGGPSLSVELLSRNLLAVASSRTGLRLFDVSDPRNPVERGSVVFDSPAVDVEVAGDLAYVALGTGGVAVVDISTPEFPKVVGRSGAVASIDIDVVGEYLIAGDDIIQRGAIKVFDRGVLADRPLILSLQADSTPMTLFIQGPNDGVIAVEVSEDLTNWSERQVIPLNQGRAVLTLPDRRALFLRARIVD